MLIPQISVTSHPELRLLQGEGHLPSLPGASHAALGGCSAGGSRPARASIATSATGGFQ